VNFKKQAAAGILFALPALAGILIFYIIPYFLGLFYSFTTGISNKSFIGFENYSQLFRNGTFLLSLKNTLIFTAISIPLVIIISFSIALFLNTFTKQISFIRGLFIIPLIVPTASVTNVWKIIFGDYGLINGMLNKFGLNSVRFFDGKFAMAMVILIFVWKNCAYNIILFSVALSKIPKGIIEHAQLDGASKLSLLKYITIPMVSPTTFFVFLLSIISSFKIFREVFLLYGNYPNENVYFLQHFMNNNFYNLDYARLSSASTILSVFLIAVLLIFFIRDKRKNYLE